MNTVTVTETDSSFKGLLANALVGSEIVSCNRSEFHCSQERNARPSSHPAYSDEAIAELATSIEAFGGLFDPLILSGIKAREETGFAQYMLVSGHRRVMALDRLAAETGNSKWVEDIPCRIAQSGNQTSIVRALQLVENAGRKDLDIGSVAQSLVDIHKSLGGDVSIEEVCKIVGANKDQVEVYKRVVELPQAVKDSISCGDLTDKKVFLLADSKYEIGDTEWAGVLRLAKQLSATGFKSALDRMFAENSEGEPAPAAPKAKGLKSTDLKKYFVPAIVERFTAMDTSAKDYVKLCETLKDGEAAPPRPDCLVPRFSARDVEARILDSLNVMLGTQHEKSPLMAVVTPFMDAIKETEATTKASAKAVTARDKWVKKQVTGINKCLKLPMDVVTGKRPYSSLSDALAATVVSWGNMSAAEANDVGFDLAAELGKKETKEALAHEVHTVWVATENSKRERAVKAEKKKADAAAAAAATTAAAA